MKTYREAVMQHMNEIDSITEYSDSRVYEIGQFSALETMYQTAISCSVGHDISDHDTMFIIDHYALTETYNKLIKEL